MYAINHIQAPEVEASYSEELNKIITILDVTKKEVTRQMGEIKSNWQDDTREEFFDKMESFVNAIDGFSNCCEKTKANKQTSTR